MTARACAITRGAGAVGGRLRRVAQAAGGNPGRDTGADGARRDDGGASGALRPGRIPPLLAATTSTPPGRPGLLAPVVRRDPARVYVPNSKSNTVDVISQRTVKVVDHFATGGLPQHVTPVLGPADAVGHQRHRQQRSRRSTRARAATAGRVPVTTRTTSTSPPTGAARSWSPRRTASSTSASRTRCACATRCTCPAARASTTWTSPPTAGYALVSCEFAGPLIEVDLRRERVVGTHRARARARCRRTSSSRPTAASSTSPTWRRTASG